MRLVVVCGLLAIGCRFVPGINSSKTDGDASITADGADLFFASGASTLSIDIYEVTRTCQ